MTDKPHDYKLDRDEAELAAHVGKMVQADMRDALIVSGCETPTTVELLAGRPFRSASFYSDAAFWAVSILADEGHQRAKLPPSIQQALRELAAKPDRMKIVRLRRAAKRRRLEWSAEYLRRLDAILDRCTVYIAATKDTGAVAERTALAFRMFDVHNATPNNLDVLIRAIVASTGQDYERIVDDVLPKIWVHAKAQRMILRGIDLHAWHGGYKQATKSAPDDYRPPVDLGDLDVESDTSSPPAPPTLVVVGSLDHLAGKPPAGLGHKVASAKGEYGHLAGKPLPLLQASESELVIHQLREEWPWATEAIDAIADGIARSETIDLPNLLFVGVPGTGKSSLALKAGHLLGLEPTLYACAGASDAAFAGTSRQWGSARASVPLQAVSRTGCANPLIVLDEIEKIGTRLDNGSLHQALIPFLEETTSRAMFDLYLECPVDLSAVNWIATANGLAGISQPLLDRFHVIQIPAPDVEHLPVICRQILAEIRVKRGLDEAWLPDFDGDEIDVLASAWKGGSMRGLRRMIETMIAGRDRLATRN